MRFKFMLGLLAAILPATCTETLREKFISEKDAEYMNATTVCEGRPGVLARSGYLKVDSNNTEMNVWFSLYDARRDTFSAPMIIYIPDTGLAGSHEMVSENGPCFHPTNRKMTATYASQHSLNTWANLLYIDFPGLGFTKTDFEVLSQEDTSEFLRKFLIKLREKFPRYFDNGLIMWTLGYGSQLTTTFTADTLRRNEVIRAATAAGGDTHDAPFHIKAMVLDSPLLDLPIQHKALIDWAANNDVHHSWPGGSLIRKGDAKYFLKKYAELREKSWIQCSKNWTANCTTVMPEYMSIFKKMVSKKLARQGWLPNTSNIEGKVKNLTSSQSDREWTSGVTAQGLDSEDIQRKMGVIGGTVNTRKVDYWAFNRDIWKRIWEGPGGYPMRTTMPNLEYILNAGRSEEGQNNGGFQPSVRTIILTGGSDLMYNPLGVHQVVESLDFPYKDLLLKSKPTALYIYKRRSLPKFKKYGRVRGNRDLRIGEVTHAGNLVIYRLNRHPHDISRKGKSPSSPPVVLFSMPQLSVDISEALRFDLKAPITITFHDYWETFINEIWS